MNQHSAPKPARRGPLMNRLTLPFYIVFQNRILGAYATSFAGIFSGLLTNLWLPPEIMRDVSVHEFGVYAS